MDDIAMIFEQTAALLVINVDVMLTAELVGGQDM